MRKLTTIISAFVMAFMLSVGIVWADTPLSGGQVVIPPFTVHYQGATHYSAETLNLANISSDTIHVVVEYYKQSGDVVKTIELDLSAKASTVLHFDGSDTPNTVMYCYGVIRWSGPSMLQKPLLAHATMNYFYQTSSFRNYNITSLPVNNGMPF